MALSMKWDLSKLYKSFDAPELKKIHKNYKANR